MDGMGLIEELAEQTARSATKCPVALQLREMDSADAKELQQAMDTNYTAVLISRVLKNRGIELNPRSIQNHRRSACSCRS